MPVFPECTRRLVLALQEQDALDAYYTTILDHPENRVTSGLRRAVAALGADGLDRQIRRRSFLEVDYERVHQRPGYMALRLLAGKAFKSPRLTDWAWERGDHDFDRWVARQLRPGLDAVVAEEHAALATLRRARALGAVAVLEQVSLHHTQFLTALQEQVRLRPELRNAQVDLYESELTAQRDARRDAELAAADVVLCHSEVTKRSVVAAGVDPEAVDVVPMGFPNLEPRPAPEPGPLTFLYAGSQIVRKGTHLLFEAWRGLDAPDVALRTVGTNTLPESVYLGLPGDAQVRGHVPQEELFALYRQAGVFVFPTLSDGFAMVVAEAMATGLPVITTTEAGAAEFIDHGRNGFIVPAGDVEALRAQMAWCAQHRDRLPEVGAAAVETARSWPWSAYESAVVDALEKRVHDRSAA